MKANRNDRCPCGSGLKIKHCCQGKDKWYKPSRWTGIMLLILVLGGLVLVGLKMLDEDTASQRGGAPPGQVWSPEHGHYHDVQ